MVFYLFIYLFILNCVQQQFPSKQKQDAAACYLSHPMKASICAERFYSNLNKVRGAYW